MTLNFLPSLRLSTREFQKVVESTFKILFLTTLMIPATAISRSLPFLFSSDLPAQQKQTVLADLNALNHIHYSDARKTGAKLFGVPLTTENLKKWLADRSHYVVGENFDYLSKIRVITPGAVYPKADLLPYREVAPPPSPEGSGGRVVTVMSNTGTQIYVRGKRTKNLLAVDIPGIGAVTVTSPRTGIFKIGAGLFVPVLQNGQSEDTDFISMGNSLRRLAVYFHEARHSDGNGKSIGFLHAPCPAEKGVYAGSFACDRNQNGPYAIEGTFLRSTVDSCRACTRREKEALRNVYADKFNRLVKTGTVSGDERIPTDSAADTCKNLKALNVNASALAACNSARRVQPSAPQTGPEVRPAWLDERPEGIAP